MGRREGQEESQMVETLMQSARMVESEGEGDGEERQGGGNA